MNKDDLISKVASSIGISKSEAAKSVDAVFSSITNSLKGGNEVRLVGFGTFLITNRAATTGRNPRTGESIQIPAKKVPKFRAGKALKETVN
jgi:DNA-binding protein HU-beta